MIEEFERYPLPPPWRFIAAEGAYINDDTGDVSTIHPYQRLMDRRAAEQEVVNVGTATGKSSSSAGNTESKSQDNSGSDRYPSSTANIDGLGHLREDGSDGPLFVEETSLVEVKSLNDGEKAETQLQVQDTGTHVSVSNSAGVPITAKTLKAKMKGQKYTDFRCGWKELSLLGETNSYGLVIRYYPNGQVLVKFDGVDGQWLFNQMMGPYGPLDRYDLFVGAKINIFGRHMTISTAGASCCHWIEEEGTRLSKQQEWLQKRVESVGEVPLVHRAPPPGLHPTMSSKPAGGVNLRQVHNNNTKLLDQLSRLGMSMCVPPQYYTRDHKVDTEKNFCSC